jgi:1-acyl-sn-glycerol-3-phosphate acyltransferase
MRDANKLELYLSRPARLVRTVAQEGLRLGVWAVLRVRVSGRENLAGLDASRGFLVAANHSSHFDAPLVVVALPRRHVRWLATAAAKDTFFRQSRKAFWTKLFFNAFPVDRDGSGEHKGLASRLLEAGTPILIMPEGTRSRTGELGELKVGTARLAISNQVPIVPLTIVGAHAAWPPQRKWWRAGRPRVRVAVGKPIVPKPRETAEQLTQRLRKAIAK